METLAREPAAAFPWTVYANTKTSVSIAVFCGKTSKAARLSSIAATLGMLMKTKEQCDKILLMKYSPTVMNSFHR